MANPGCYPTAVQLGLLPLLEADVVKVDGLIADAKSGVSGAEPRCPHCSPRRRIISEPMAFRGIAICQKSARDWSAW